jgi:hypothetical protein
VPGTYVASVTLGGEHVQGSPFETTLMPGEACVEACELVEPLHAFHHPVAGETLHGLPLVSDWPWLVSNPTCGNP